MNALPWLLCLCGIMPASQAASTSASHLSVCCYQLRPTLRPTLVLTGDDAIEWDALTDTATTACTLQAPR